MAAIKVRVMDRSPLGDLLTDGEDVFALPIENGGSDIAMMPYSEYEQQQAELAELKATIRGKTLYYKGCAGEIEQVRAAFKAEIERLKNE